MRNNLNKVMQKIKTYILSFTLLMATACAVITPLSVSAAGSCTDSDGQTVTTSVLDCPSGKEGRGIIWDLLTVVINFLAAGVGLAVLAGIIFGAVTYATAADSADQAKKGIGYVTNAVIGLLLFIFMYAIINFLVPGGLF